MSAREAHPMLDGMSEAMRATFLREMTRGYATTARKAHRKMRECLRIGDDREASANRQDVVYCMMMARLVRRGILDPPEMHHSKYTFDDAIADKHALLAVMVDVEEKRNVALDKRKREIVEAAMYVLTPMERQVAEVYYVGQVAREDAPELLTMELLTFDTHVRNIGVKWREFVGALSSGRGVQPVMLAHIDDDPAPVVAKERRVRVVETATSTQANLFGSQEVQP